MARPTGPIRPARATADPLCHAALGEGARENTGDQGLVSGGENPLRNLANGGVLALEITDCLLALYDADPRILQLFKPIRRSPKDKAFGLHGEPGAGKTPLARSIAMALSRLCLRQVGSDEPASLRRRPSSTSLQGTSAGSLPRSIRRRIPGRTADEECESAHRPGQRRGNKPRTLGCGEVRLWPEQDLRCQ